MINAEETTIYLLPEDVALSDDFDIIPQLKSAKYDDGVKIKGQYYNKLFLSKTSDKSPYDHPAGYQDDWDGGLLYRKPTLMKKLGRLLERGDKIEVRGKTLVVIQVENAGLTVKWGSPKFQISWCNEIRNIESKVTSIAPGVVL